MSSTGSDVLGASKAYPAQKEIGREGLSRGSSPCFFFFSVFIGLFRVRFGPVWVFFSGKFWGWLVVEFVDVGVARCFGEWFVV